MLSPASRLKLAFIPILFTFLTLISYIIYRYYFLPPVVILPHHDIVRSTRFKFLIKVASRRLTTDTIILLSPDHFNPNQHLISSTDSPWQTFYGPVAHAANLDPYFKPLIHHHSVAVKQDHGLSAPLSEIKLLFPQAKLMPLLLGQALNQADLQPLVDVINQTCHRRCLLIASVDFSHYLPANLANLHDAFSLKTLASSNLDQVLQLEVDSPQALYLAIAHARHQRASRFIIQAHTNSGLLFNNLDLETTSHVFAWYQLGPAKPLPSQTFIIATNLNPNPPSKTVGARFFYGADITQSNLNSTISPTSNLTINPVSTTSSLIQSPDHLTLNLANDLVVGGLIQADSTQLYFFPLSTDPLNQQFLRGPSKQAALFKLLSPFSDSLSSQIHSGTLNLPKKTQTLP